MFCCPPATGSRFGCSVLQTATTDRETSHCVKSNSDWQRGAERMRMRSSAASPANGGILPHRIEPPTLRSLPLSESLCSSPSLFGQAREPADPPRTHARVHAHLGLAKRCMRVADAAPFSQMETREINLSRFITDSYCSKLINSFFFSITSLLHRETASDLAKYNYHLANPVMANLFHRRSTGEGSSFKKGDNSNLIVVTLYSNRNIQYHLVMHCCNFLAPKGLSAALGVS